MITLHSGPSHHDFVLSRTQVKNWLGQHKAIAAFEGARCLAAVVYDAFTPYDCCMHVAIDDRRCVTRRIVKAMFHYPFVQLHLSRVTALICADNLEALNLAYRLGFKFEGCRRRAMGERDEIMLGMLKEECRWV